MKRCVLWVAVLACVGGMALDARGAWSPGQLSDPTDFGVRFRSFGNTGGEEVYLGVPDLGQAGNRVAQNFTWNDQEPIIPFQMQYDSSSGQLTSKLGTAPLLTYSLAPSLTIDGVEIVLANRDAGGLVSLQGVQVNGDSSASFSNTSGWAFWNSTTFPSSNVLTISGQIFRAPNQTGFSNSQESAKIEILVAASENATVPEPASLAVWGALGLIGLGGMRFRRKRCQK